MYYFKEGKYVKTIKPELILYMDYIILAHFLHQKSNINTLKILLAGRTAAEEKNFIDLYICVEGFTTKDVIVLMNILIIKYNVSCELRSSKNKNIIIIHKNSVSLLLKGVGPIFNSLPKYVTGTSSKKKKYSLKHSPYLFLDKRSVKLFSTSIDINTNTLYKPFLSYENADLLKKSIVNDNKGKAGVYK